jgi:hypothetical protein
VYYQRRISISFVVTQDQGKDIDRYGEPVSSKRAKRHYERDESYGAGGAGSEHDSEGKGKSPRGEARSGRVGKAGRPRGGRGAQEAKKG